MSFSVSTRKPSKLEAINEAVKQVHACTKDQRAHDADRAVIIGAITGAACALPDDADKDFSISAYGSASAIWKGNEPSEMISTEFTVRCALLQRDPS